MREYTIANYEGRELLNNFTLYFGTAEELLELSDKLEEEEDCIFFFKNEWLDGKCKQYCIEVTYYDEFGDHSNCPEAHLLSQAYMKTLESVVKKYTPSSDGVIICDDFFEHEEYQQAIISDDNLYLGINPNMDEASVHVYEDNKIEVPHTFYDECGNEWTEIMVDDYEGII